MKFEALSLFFSLPVYNIKPITSFTNTCMLSFSTFYNYLYAKFLYFSLYANLKGIKYCCFEIKEVTILCHSVETLHLFTFYLISKIRSRGN